MTFQNIVPQELSWYVSTHMPLARHDRKFPVNEPATEVSTHMPLARHDSNPVCAPSTGFLFLLTCLLRGMTAKLYKITKSNLFLLTCLLRGMTLNCAKQYHIFRFLLTCLLRGMTQRKVVSLVLVVVSTHMPLARHDPARTNSYLDICGFYSHASCEA